MEGHLLYLIYFPEKDAPYFSDYCNALILIHSNAKKIYHFDLDLLLSSTDINLYVTLSECHSIMFEPESFAFGKSCIINDVSNIYDFDGNLRK